MPTTEQTVKDIPKDSKTFEERLAALEKEIKVQPTIFWAKMHPEGQAPRAGNDGDAGYDLYCVGQHIFAPGEQKKVPTGIAIQLPPGCWAEIKDRSGMANAMWRTSGGVMDEIYRGEYEVLIQNMTPNQMMLNSGDRIAQFVVQRYVKGKLEQREKLDETVRGARGFGSSGN